MGNAQRKNEPLEDTFLKDSKKSNKKPKLGIVTRVPHETTVASGCSKTSDWSCGANRKQG